MIAIAAVAVLLSLVRFISQRPVLLGISFGLLVLFGTSACILVTAFVVDLLAGARNQASSRFVPPREEPNEIACVGSGKIRECERPTHRSTEFGMNDRAKPVSRPRRRFLRLSVRGLIIVVLVIGVGLAWLVRSARIKRQAVAAIERAGGAAGYESKLYRGHFPRVTRAEKWRNWAANLIGIEYFDDVTYVRNLVPTSATLG